MKYHSLFNLWKAAALENRDLVLFSDNKGDNTVTYREAFSQMCFISCFLKEKGLKKQERAALFALNFTHWLILEQAVISQGAVCVSKASDIGLFGLQYIYESSGASVLITDNKKVIEYFADKGILNNTKLIIYTGEEKPAGINAPEIFLLKDILKKWAEAPCFNEETADLKDSPDDAAFLIYTSGTSAEPKGALITNGCTAYAAEEIQKFNAVNPGSVFITAFPLASSGGKSFAVSCLSAGCRIIFTPYKEFWETCLKYKPDYLHIAPKIVQTMRSKFYENVSAEGFIFKKLFDLSYLISKKLMYLKREGRAVFISALVTQVLDRLIYKKIRNTLFKDDIEIFIGSAHLAEPLEDFLQIMNIKHVQHYGLTETAGTAVSNTIKSQKKHPYTAGIPFSKTQLKILNPETKEEVKQGETGLIAIKGASLFKGYYNNEEASKKAFLENGFFNTGDLGFLDKDGFLTVLSRYDSVIVLSNGYNIYTPIIESRIINSKYVKEAAAAGHGRPYLSALISINEEEYKKYLSETRVKEYIPPDKNESFKAFLLEDINRQIKEKPDYRYYEDIKKIYILKDGFTAENGMLTGTYKVKYKKVLSAYNDIIDNLYKEE